jgi:hypothetical protein
MKSTLKKAFLMIQVIKKRFPLGHKKLENNKTTFFSKKKERRKVGKRICLLLKKHSKVKFNDFDQGCCFN